jgi:hypothetical protein
MPARMVSRSLRWELTVSILFLSCSAIQFMVEARALISWAGPPRS